jgi:hypothetical protein
MYSAVFGLPITAAAAAGTIGKCPADHVFRRFAVRGTARGETAARASTRRPSQVVWPRCTVCWVHGRPDVSAAGMSRVSAAGGGG